MSHNRLTSRAMETSVQGQTQPFDGTGFVRVSSESEIDRRFMSGWAARSDRIGADQDGGDDARLGAAHTPGMIGAALDEDVAGL